MTDLPDYNLIGCIYDVKYGEIASAGSVEANKQMFTVDASDMRTVTVWGNEYQCPEELAFTSTLDTTNIASGEGTFTSQEVQEGFGIKIGLDKPFSAFSAEIETNYSSNRKSEVSFFEHKTTSDTTGYKLSLPMKSELREYLKESALEDIDSMDPDELIETWGTHFVYSAYFGGAWGYSESVARVYASSETEVDTRVSANYATVSSEITTSHQVIEIEDVEQSNLVINIKGGDPTAITEGQSAWAQSVKDGNITLSGFDNSGSEYSLVPISELAGNEKREQEILEAIEGYLAVDADYKYLRWDSESMEEEVVNEGAVEEEFQVPHSNLVITGLAFKVDDQDLTRLAYQTLNLDDGSTDWQKANGGTYNQADYEEVISMDDSNGGRGYALVGLALNAGDTLMYSSELYGQALDPADVDNNQYLSPKVKKFGKADKQESPFIPGDGNEYVIVGIKIGVYNGDIGALYLTRAKLMERS